MKKERDSGLFPVEDFIQVLLKLVLKVAAILLDNIEFINNFF